MYNVHVSKPVVVPEGQLPGEDDEQGREGDEAVDGQAQQDRAEVPAQLLELSSDILDTQFIVIWTNTDTINANLFMNGK